MVKRNLEFIVFVFLVMFCFLAFGCSLPSNQSTGTPTVSEMTSTQKAAIMMGTYNSQFADYMRMTGYIAKEDGKWEKISDPVLTDDQKAALAKKKKILMQIYPFISIYTVSVSAGQTVSVETEQQIFILLDSLASLAPD